MKKTTLKIEKLEDYLKAFENSYGIFGVFLVAKAGRTLYSKSFGYSCIEHKVKNHPDTKFLIASMTKQFTAYAILMLISKRKLDLSTNLDHYISGIPNGKQISIHHLLTHTAGVFNFTDFPDFERKRLNENTFDKAMTRIKSALPTGKPGESFRYSNTGYWLLGKIIELVSEMPYGEFLKKNMFNKLGMKNTGLLNNHAVVPNLAHGYEIAGTEILHALPENPIWGYSSGGLYSTVEDLLLWNRDLINDTPLIGKRKLDPMFKKYYGNYGYGMTSGLFQGETFFGHSGKADGYSSEQCVLKNDKLIILSLFNKNRKYIQAHPTSTDLLKILFDEQVILSAKAKKQNLPKDITKILPGEYKAEGLPVDFSISIENNTVILEYIHPGYMQKFYAYYYLTTNSTFQDINGPEEVSYNINIKDGIVRFGGINKIMKRK